ncbi:MAG: ABC transporter permease subunit [Spirochaetaceae bacterium]|nr:ABC transporter permease subunit [Spirochaetaceae bacterium]
MSNRIPLKKPTLARYTVNATLIALLALTAWGFLTIDTKGIDLFEAAGQTLRYMGIMFGRPAATTSHWGLPADSSSWTVFFQAVKTVTVTLALAFLTTLIGAVMALVLGLFAARNLTSDRVSNIIKGTLSVIRAIPTVLWVLIFAIGAGLGAVAAVIGMSFHTVSHLQKAYSESFEELDEGVIEALRASGATWPQIVFQAVLPSSITSILSWTFIRFELNFAVAVAMGAAAGAGGIGYELYMSSGYYFDMPELGYITYLIIAVALVIEVIAIRLKKRYHLHE